MLYVPNETNQITKQAGLALSNTYSLKRCSIENWLQNPW